MKSDNSNPKVSDVFLPLTAAQAAPATLKKLACRGETATPEAEVTLNSVATIVNGAPPSVSNSKPQPLEVEGLNKDCSRG